MFLPESVEDNNTQTVVTQWLGYNHNYSIGIGELYDEENLTSDNYPLLTPRKTRARLIGGHPVMEGVEPENPSAGDYWLNGETLKKYSGSAWEASSDTYEDGDYGKYVPRHIRGILLSDDKLAYLDGTTLYYGSNAFDLSGLIANDDTEQQLIRFGAYILIFPAGVYVNAATAKEQGTLAAIYTAPSGTVVTYTQCSATGEEFSNVSASDTEPESPTAGQYWLCTKSGSEGLNQYNANTKSWEAVSATYIKVQVSDTAAKLGDLFAENDAIFMNTELKDINNGSIALLVGDNYIVVSGLMVGDVTKQETVDNTWALKLERRLPDLDYVCTSNNRVWGCHYGYEQDGSMTNEIYACRLGDPKNWYSYQGLSTDAYALSIGIPGEWTGAIEYGGYPMFFKEDHVFKIYGSQPSSYSLVMSTCRGVQKGSYKSLAVINEYLVYKSPSDVCVYDGSSPTSISEKLGTTVYYDAVGGGCLGKYHVLMETASGTKYYFVYDFAKGLWEKESALPIEFISTSESGQIYAATSTDIYGIGANENSMFLSKLTGEEYVSWYAETGDIGLSSVGYKTLSKITLRAFIEEGAEVQLWISYDRQPFEELQTLRGVGTLVTYTIPVVAYRCDNYRIRFRGHGNVRIYSMATTYEEGSDENGEYSI